MRILFMGLSVPQLQKTGNLYGQLIKEIHKNGHDILVIAPCYTSEKPGMQEEEGIKVIRVATMNLFDVGIITKGLANILLPYQYKIALKKANISLDFDVVIIPTPPITLGVVASWLKRKYNSRVYLILRDIFPQNAIDLKIMSRKNPLYHYFRFMEKKLYKTSDHIGCMSKANVNYIVNHNPGVDQTKMHLFPNWNEMEKITDEQNNKITKYPTGLDSDKLIVLFGGNMGLPQKLENILDLANECRDLNMQFVFVGRGTEREKLKNLALSMNLNNALFLDPLPHHEYLQLLKLSDIGLISLSEDFTIPNFPSKVLSYFNLGKPVLASIDSNTDFGEMLEVTQSGLWSEAGNTEDLKKKLMMLYTDEKLREVMGRNGYEYMKNNLLPSHAYNRFYKYCLKTIHK